MKRYLACLAAIMASACSVGLETPDTTIITCGSDAECPSNYKCEVSAGRCFDTRISVPRVLIGPVARSVGDVAISITLADSQGDNATISGAYDIGAGFTAASLDGATDLKSASTGVQHVITWHAGADIGNNAYRDGVKLRLTAKGGPTSESAAFAYGDDAPLASNITFAGTSPYSGNIIVRFDVSDSSSDPIAVAKLEVSYSGSFDDTVVIFDDATSVAANVIPSGALTSLDSSPTGVTHAVTWSSSTTSVVDAPGSVLRVTLRDAFMESVPADSAPFYLRNQTPPRVISAASPAALAHHVAGPLPISYRLVDENSDLASVVVEYTSDGDNFAPCDEYPAAESEGLTDLVTASEAVGGVEHVFVWDPTGVTLHGGAIAIRVRADTPGDIGQLVTVPNGAGETMLGAFSTPMTSVTVSAGDTNTPFALGDLNGDGLVDIVISGAGSESANRYDSAALGVSPAPAVTTVVGPADPSPTEDLVDLALADFDDTLIVRNSVTLRLTSGGTRATGLVTGPASSGAVTTGDFDGDGHLDFLLRRTNELALYFGDGHAAFAPVTSLSVTGLTAVATAHVNGDAATDLYVRDATKLYIYASTGNRASPFIVQTLDTTGSAVFEACDVNSDGLTDLFVADATFSAVNEYILEAGGILRGPFLLSLDKDPLLAIACADLDADGTNDLVTAMVSGNRDSLYPAYNRGSADGVADFNLGAAIYSDTNASPLSSIREAKQFDGRSVIAYQRTSPTTVKMVALAQINAMSSGIVAPGKLIPAAARQYTTYTIADFDNDGIEDHILAEADGTAQLWHGSGVRGLASGALSEAVNLPFTGITAIYSGDANADGNFDVWHDGLLHYGNGDGTFASSIAAADLPSGFRNVPQTSDGQVLPSADFDGDGVYDAVPPANGLVNINQGSYTGVPGTGNINSPYDPFPTSYTTRASFAATGNSTTHNLFVADINDDGVPDVIRSTGPSANTFALYYGQVEQSFPRTRAVVPYGASSTTPSVYAIASDLVGARVAFHPARGAVDETFLWEDSLVDAGLLASTFNQRPFTIPYELRGDVRLTAVTPVTTAKPALRVDARFGERTSSGNAFARAGLDANQRGLIIDLPTMAGITSTHVNNVNNKVFVRVTDYDNLDKGTPKRRFTWVEIPRDPDSDLATGTGARYVTVALGTGYVVRVLTDRSGIFVAYTP